ncbi:MAG: ArsR/SmtB family transcription factor [Aristaeellaceae bacterium]
MVEMDAALICKALSGSNRLRIVQSLSAGEMCACRLLEQFSITQPTLSHHMRVLCECGLIHVRREGKWSHYSLNHDTLTAFRQFIDGLSRCPSDTPHSRECD